MSFGDPDAEYSTKVIRQEERYYREAIARDINPSLSNDEICRQIQRQLPSAEYLIRNMQTFAHLPRAEQSMLHAYTSYGFARTNQQLRANPNLQAELNEVIDLFPPLEKDIVVYRITRRYLPGFQRDVYVSHGYLSTSLDAVYLMETSCDDAGRGVANLTFIKIHVPAGTRCIYIPGHEVELLFKHNLYLRLLEDYIGQLLCPGPLAVRKMVLRMFAN